jgi:hypothetical protein
VRSILISCILIFSVSTQLRAQYYDTGQDPSSVKWMQIKTPRFMVIYPESYGNEGIRFARSLDASYTKLGALFPDRKFRIPVIIHNYTTYSNGYVAWAPKRMEIYPTAEQNGIPLDAVEQLTTHELTHVLQMTSLNKGFTKVLSYIGGEQITGAMTLFLPLWFMEGDAVFAESLLSPSGRGRSAAFQKQLKALVLEEPGLYNYDKMVSGSYRNFVPDHYQYGYQMMAWSYAKYNQSLWNKALDYTARYPFTLNPVNQSLTENAGITKKMLFRETFDSLKTIWRDEAEKRNPRDYKPLNPARNVDFVSYYSPVPAGTDSVIAIRTSMSYPPRFVLLDLKEKSERPIHVPGTMYPYSLSGANGKLVWVEIQPDPRWENRTYSVVKIMDIRSGEIRQLSDKSRYLAAAISPDGRYIAAAESSVKNQNSLVILDGSSGTIVKSIPVPGNAYPQKPQWSQTGDDISIIFLDDNGEGIMVWSMKNNRWRTLLNSGRNDLQSAVLRNDSLFFVSSVSGTDNVFLLAPDSSLSKITDSRYGAYDPLPVSGKIVFSDYSISGYNICEAGITDNKPIAAIKKGDAGLLINRFDTVKIKERVDTSVIYKPVPYKKARHIFRFHSWMPLYADLEKVQADPASVRPGFMLLSQNQLSTVISTFGYEYTAEKTSKFHAGITWKGWYPVLESRIEWGGTAGVSTLGYNAAPPESVRPAFSFKNTVSIPLVFSSGRFSQFLQPSVSADYENNYLYVNERSVYDYGQVLVTGRLFLNNYYKYAFRDIYPRWAQSIDLIFTFAPFDNDIYGSAKTLKSAFYLPGFVRNHGIRLRFETEIQDPQKLFYYNRASMPRGWDNVIPEKINFMSGDYVMPLIYPDLNLPGVIFIRRIRGSLFYDYARGAKNHYFNPKDVHNFTETFSSFGGELWCDFYILRIPFMVSAGLQSTWKSVNEVPSFKFLLNIDIFGTRIGHSGIR